MNLRLTPTQSSIPQAFFGQMQLLLGDDFPSFEGSQAQPPTAGLRANALKIDPARLLERLGLAAEALPWCPAGFGIQPGLPLGAHPYHAAGLYYLQDPSAMAVAQILAPQPGERVLDLSAAPGGKSTHLAALMQDQGLLVANEIHPRRAWELAENLERWGAHNTVITNNTPARLADHFGAFFDRVLLDAPCSGEGMFRKSEPARRDWSTALVQSCAARQGEILEQAARLVRPGGRLVYSTCTFNPQENEAVVERFLEEPPANGSWRLVIPPACQGFSPGRPDWLASSRPELARAVRLWPHRAPGEGHFIALLEKDGKSVDYSADDARRKAHPIDSGMRKLFTEFSQQFLRIAFDPSRLHQVGSYLYLLPESLPNLSSLKVIHPGWWLGSFKKGRFEPAHALALGLKSDQARQCLDLGLETTELKAYLRGETLASPGQDGWALVTVDGFPLGWGRRVQGVIKNYYPHGLRKR